MARKKYLLAVSLALAAIAPATLAGCGGSPATPTVSTSTTPGAAPPNAGTPSIATAPITGTVPGEVPTVTGNAPLPQGTGEVPAAVPSTQP